MAIMTRVRLMRGCTIKTGSFGDVDTREDAASLNHVHSCGVGRDYTVLYVLYF